MERDLRRIYFLQQNLRFAIHDETKRSSQALILGFSLVPPAIFAQTSQSVPVTLTDKPTTVTLSNGIVSVAFWKKGAQFRRAQPHSR